MPNIPADDVVGLYQHNAEEWRNLRRCDLFERAWLDRFLGMLPPKERNVLDLGCGSGHPIARYLIDNACQVTGLDAATSLLEIAADAFPEQTWIAADMRDIPPIGKFNGIIAWHSFFHLTPADQRPMFETFNRLARPGAALIFTSGTHLGEAIGTFAGQPLYHGSLDPAEYHQLLQATGFDVVDHVENDPTCGQANIWLARKASVVG